MNSQSPPKGSLEELFRHHLLESEAAAVPPRPLVWEHIDNSLLLAQNEKYRRRLLVHRWGMAASLLLAALAGGGWWHSQQAATAHLTSANPLGSAAQVAVARATMASQHSLGNNDNQRVASKSVPYTSATRQMLGESTVATETAGATSQGTTQAAALASAQADLARGSRSAGHRTLGTLAASAKSMGHGTDYRSDALAVTTRRTGTSAAARSSVATTGASTADLAASFSSSTKAQPIGSTATSSLVRFSQEDTRQDQPLATATAAAASTLLPTASAGLGAESAPLLATNRLGEAALASRPVALALGSAEGLPTTLVLADVTLPPATKLRRWQFGVEYAASAFNPNIDFNRNVTSYNTTNNALGFNTVSATKSAAAEYRANLRMGLGQRLGLRATRWLGGHWSLSTGLEATQQTAYSATSSAFVGEQLFDLGNVATSPMLHELRTSSFRYRSAGIPVELRYDNPIKTGVSFYGRLGAIVSALLNVRSEVAGNPEASRTYSFFSASTPYRRLTALLRGSAGVHYRPAHHSWGLNVGPTAEAGMQSMNAETDKTFLQQNRPYSFGLEAGFEFGGGLVPAP